MAHKFETQRQLGARGQHGFSWGLPYPIKLPYPAPKPAHSAAYWAHAENIVAAFNAGFAAAAMAAEGKRIDPAPEPAWRTVAATSSEDRARAAAAQWIDCGYIPRLRHEGDYLWAVDIARSEEAA